MLGLYDVIFRNGFLKKILFGKVSLTTVFATAC